MAPTLSASGSVGEGRVEGSGGERRGMWPYAAIQGRVWAAWAARERKTRTSEAKWAVVLLKTDAMTFRGQPADLSSAISTLLTATDEGDGEVLTSLVHAHIPFLPPHPSNCAIIKAREI